MSKNSQNESSLRQAIEDISNKLCVAVDGRFDFSVHPELPDETVLKLGMLINFVIDAARRSLADLAEKNAKLSELDRLKSDFIANVSHEIRTPLTLILGPLSSLLLDPQLEGATRSNLERMNRNAEKLLALVNDLLDFARLEAGKLVLETQPLALNDFIDALLEDAQATAEVRQLDLSYVRCPGDDTVMVDPRKCEKIVLNLIANALKFTPEGGRIQLSANPSADFIELVVADTGVGIPEQKLHLIFQRFHQIESSPNRRFEGTGIGLALVKEFAELMGGSVRVESKEGEGSRFFVRFPRAHAEAEAKMSAVSVPVSGVIAQMVPVMETNGVMTPAREDPRKPLLLVVEDNIDMREYLREALWQDYRIRHARNGKDALDQLAHLTPDVIVTDLMMPEMDGIELVTRVKADERLRHVPVILLTARAGASSVCVGLEAGADDYLAKPFGADELRARIHACLRLRRLLLEKARLETERDHSDREMRAKEELLMRERDARQAAERLGRMKDEFLATLSHELRTPLGSILGWTQLLRSNSTVVGDNAVSSGLEIIERNTRIQSRLIGDLLELSEIIAGKVRLNLQDVELGEFAESLVAAGAPAAAAKGIELRLEIPDRRFRVRADSSRLQQIFGNLLVNAMKFTERGGTITISVTEADGEAGISIRDTGRGIQPEFLPYMFDRFRQEDSSTTRKYGGLGIGLSVVKQLVTMHGGRVFAHSEGEGRGSTITVMLPIQESAGSEDDSDTAPPGFIEKEPLKGVHILVVEDDTDTREMICRLLESYCATVYPTRSAIEALECLQQKAFDVMVADIGMPEMDGYELMRRIRAMLDGQDLQAIALTAYALPEDRARAMDAGYQLHLAKPIDAVDLVVAVGSLIGARAGE